MPTMKLRRARLGPLDAHVVAPATPTPGRPVVVLLHGFGAPGSDLVGLAGELRAPEGTSFVFPAAPLDLGPLYGGGRAWWMIDIAALQRAMQAGAFRDLAREVPVGLAEARAAMVGVLDAVDAELAPSRVALGGFSQGAMLAADVALATDRPLAALLLFSPTLIAEREWSARVAARAGLPVAMSHGRRDPILPYQGAERLRALFEEGGLQVAFQSFDGEHAIPYEALDNASVVLDRALADG